MISYPKTKLTIRLRWHSHNEIVGEVFGVSSCVMIETAKKMRVYGTVGLGKRSALSYLTNDIILA